NAASHATLRPAIWGHVNRGETYVNWGVNVLKLVGNRRDSDGPVGAKRESADRCAGRHKPDRLAKRGLYPAGQSLCRATKKPDPARRDQRKPVRPPAPGHFHRSLFRAAGGCYEPRLSCPEARR